nr:hypothetical protein 13 [bacterium]
MEEERQQELKKLKADFDDLVDRAVGILAEPVLKRAGVDSTGIHQARGSLNTACCYFAEAIQKKEEGPWT